MEYQCKKRQAAGTALNCPDQTLILGQAKRLPTGDTELRPWAPIGHAIHQQVRIG